MASCSQMLCSGLLCARGFAGENTYILPSLFFIANVFILNNNLQHTHCPIIFYKKIQPNMICRSTMKLYKQIILNVYTYILYIVSSLHKTLSVSEATQHRVLFGSLLTRTTHSFSARVPAPCTLRRLGQVPFPRISLVVVLCLSLPASLRFHP